jgi:DNA-binding XRE family transcriptional regulator
MSRKRFKTEEIIQHLRTAEIEQSKGLTQEQAAKKVGVTVTTLVRWKKEYGGMEVDQARRLKQLEQENAQLKKIVANQALDMEILKVAASGKF